MTKLHLATSIKAKGLQGLRSKAVSRPRDPKMDALVRAVHCSPHFDVAAAAVAVSEAIAASSEKAHA